jgi:cell division protein FtsX
MVINGCAMTPEEAFARARRRRRLTLATVIVVLVSLTVWVIEQITHAR